MFSVNFQVEMGFGRARRYPTFRLQSSRDLVGRAGVPCANPFVDKAVICLKYFVDGSDNDTQYSVAAFLRVHGIAIGGVGTICYNLLMHIVCGI